LGRRFSKCICSGFYKHWIYVSLLVTKFIPPKSVHQ
jgi:hypothetical protein